MVTARTQPVRDFCRAPDRAVDAPVEGGRYARMFGELPAFSADEDFLHMIGSAGGFCDAGLVAGSGVDDDATVAAGWPFLGQFVAHDITADRSPLRSHADATQLRNSRSPRLDLESVYGGGPVGSPYLYRRDDPAKLLLGPGGKDVPRNQEELALIGDPRNDVHIFVNQLQVAFLRMHNLLVDRLRADGVAELDVFAEARRASMWHYQWVLLHDYLPSLIGDELTAEIMAGPLAHYDTTVPAYIPFEFADAAFRYGHSQIRHRYRLNEGGAEYPMFPDLMGFGPVPPEHSVDWWLLFDVPGHEPAQRSKRMDGRVPASLINLPAQITGDVEVEAYHSLAARDLQRGQAIGLPSGEAIARAMNVAVLEPADVGLIKHGWRGETPLWFYILRESDVLGSGDILGPVGGRIVGEVLVGIVRADPESYVSVDPAWRPSLPAAEGEFALADILTIGDEVAG